MQSVRHNISVKTVQIESFTELFQLPKYPI